MLSTCHTVGPLELAAPQMSFKEIIHHYRQQPQARSEVFRSVTIFQARH